MLGKLVSNKMPLISWMEITHVIQPLPVSAVFTLEFMLQYIIC